MEKIVLDPNVCIVCGEHMSGGDSFGIPSHCPNASEEKWWYEPQDSGPWYCDEDDEYESDNPLERPW